MPKGIVKYRRAAQLGVLSNTDGENGGGTPPAAPPAGDPAQADPPSGGEDLGEAGKRALETERRNAKAAAKERDALAAKLKEFEDRDKSDADKLAERATASEQRASAAEARASRLEVAFEKGLTPAQAKRLVGSTREELEADADEILRDFPTTPAGPVRPTGDIAQGPRTPAAITDPRARDLAQIEQDIKAGARR